MSEIPSPEQSADKPELLACQIAIKDLADEMLSHRPHGIDINVIRFPRAPADTVIEQKLASLGIADLLLKDGESLSMPNPNSRYSELDIYVGKAQIIQVDVAAWGWDVDKNQNRLTVNENPGLVSEWGREIDLKLWYSNGTEAAAQELSAQVWSTNPGQLPQVCRDVYAPAYAEMGYDGHNQKIRSARSEEEVAEFVTLVSELFEPYRQFGKK